MEAATAYTGQDLAGSGRFDAKPGVDLHQIAVERMQALLEEVSTLGIPAVTSEAFPQGVKGLKDAVQLNQGRRPGSALVDLLIESWSAGRGNIDRGFIADQRQKFETHCEKSGLLPLFFDAEGALCMGASVSRNGGNDLRSAEELTGPVHRLNEQTILEGTVLKLVLLTAEEFHHLQAKNRAVAPAARVSVPIEERRDGRVVVDELLQRSVALRATDIAVEPLKSSSGYEVRVKVDGRFRALQRLSEESGLAVVSVLKQLGGADIANRLVPHDGAYAFQEGSKLKGLEFRLSSIPVQRGGGNTAEDVAIRLVQQSTAVMSLEQLGYLPEQLRQLEVAYRSPLGIILAAGPTGSGKTTLLTAIVQAILTPERKFLEISNPVERSLPGVTQVQVNHARELGFERLLEAAMRHAPNVLVVGEVRDRAVAAAAIQAANTGHLTLTTIHANDVFRVPSRLKNWDIEPDQLENVLAVVSQKLVRTLCVECKERQDASATLNHLFGKPLLQEAVMLHTARSPERAHEGCSCHGSGYRGQSAVGEVWVLGRGDYDQLAAGDLSSARLRERALENGFMPRVQAGLIRALEGRTSLDELVTNFGLQEFRANADLLAKTVREYRG
jgi:type II secretory ATPase GspE/PulE/Tfp pilus assembly ATPase PilB-like protein